MTAACKICPGGKNGVKAKVRVASPTGIVTPFASISIVPTGLGVRTPCRAGVRPAQAAADSAAMTASIAAAALLTFREPVRCR